MSAIAELARVNRSSFYAHFASVEQLAIYALREQFAEVTRRSLELEARGSGDDGVAARVSLRTAAILLWRNGVLLGAGSARGVSVSVIADLIRNCLASYLRHHGDDRPNAVQRAECIYVSTGLAGLFAAWLDGSIEPELDRFVETLIAQLPSRFIEAWRRPL